MISIVTPTYNSEKYLEDCIKSIINQTYKNYEHIIIDGGSSDKTLDIIKSYDGKYPMRWVSEKDHGMYDAIAKGFGMAKGDIFCWLNSDDMYMPWALEVVSRVIGTVVNGHEIKWCMGKDSRFTDDGINYQVATRKKVFPRIIIAKGWMDGKRLGCLQQESSFWKRDLYERAGGLNGEFKYAGDYHLWKNFAKTENLYVLNTVLGGFRIHEGQKSSDVNAYLNETEKHTKLQNMAAKLKVYKILARILEHAYKDLYIEVEKIKIR